MSHIATYNPMNLQLNTQFHKNPEPNSQKTYFDCMDTIIFWQQIIILSLLPLKILKICNSLPPLTTLRRCFRNTVFLRNYLLTKYLSLPVNILRNFQRVGILNTNQNTHYHQPNGFVERLIHTLKRILKKAKYNQQEEYLALFFFFFNSSLNENRISAAPKLFNLHLYKNLHSVKCLLPKNSFITETPRPRKTTHWLRNILQGNTVRIDEQNICNKKSIVIKQNN